MRLKKKLRKNNSKRAYQLVKDLITVKHGKVTTVQDRSGKCLTEERQILNRWTEYCSELRREVEAAVQSLKKGKSAGVDNIPSELVQAGGEDIITVLTTICNRIWQTGEWPTPWIQSLVITHPKKGNL